MTFWVPGMLTRLPSYSRLLLLLLSLLRDILFARAMGSMMTCEVEGKLRLKPAEGQPGKLLQICHNMVWGNVCNWRFNHEVDGEVVLQQLNCDTGVTDSIEKTGDGYLLNCSAACVGVERRLIECPHYQGLTVKSDCNHKVTAVCNKNGSPTRECMNGDLKNETNNMLHICVSGFWKPLCSSFWGHTQATVACRQLNPGKTVFRAAATYVPFETHNIVIFEHPFYCTGQEMNMTKCSIGYVPWPAGGDICNSGSVAGAECGIGSVSAPIELILTPTSSFTVEANWTQPASDSQQYSYITISCTSIDELYTTTQHAHVNVSAAGNESMHMMISGLMPNTSYNCCVSVYTELGSSEEVCDHVTTVHIPEVDPVVMLVSTVCTGGDISTLPCPDNTVSIPEPNILVSTVSVCTEGNDARSTHSCQDNTVSTPEPEVVVSTVTLVSTVAVCTNGNDTRSTPSTYEEQNLSSSASVNLMSQSTMGSASSPLPWVGGIIIGAVLATVTLFIVWAAVWMIRRRQHSQHKMPNISRDRIETFSSQTDESTGSSGGVVNHTYYRPQPYEEAQIREPEYSYAALASDVNVYDSVMEQSKENNTHVSKWELC